MTGLNEPTKIPSSIKEIYDKAVETAKSLPIPVHPSDLDYDLAYRAFYNISHSPEVRAYQEQIYYVESMANFNELAKTAKHESQKEVFISKFKEYKDLYLKAIRPYLSAKSNTASTFITGGSGFNTSRNQKKMNSESKRYDEFLEKCNKHYAYTVKLIEKARTADEISADRRKSILAYASEKVSFLTSILLGQNAPYSPTLFRNSLQNFIKKVARNGYPEDTQAVLDLIKSTQDKFGITIFAKNNAVWNLVQVSEKVEETKVTVRNIILTYTDAIVAKDYDIDRVMIFFDAIPELDERTELKRNGFKWSPKNQAWQRSNTDVSISKAKAILDKHHQIDTEIINNIEVKS